MKDRKVSKTTKLFKRFAHGRGLYIALLVLVAMVGVGMYAGRIQSDMPTDGAAFDEDAWKEAVEESGIEVIDVDEAAEDVPGTQAKEPETVPAETKSVENTVSYDTVQTSAEAVPEFSLERPCNGAILRDCSIDRLVYCETMDDWRTHNGIDIAAAIGDPVKAAEAGIVSQVYKDQLLGVVVVIDHQNGTTTLYANLQNEGFIQPGTVVKKGDIIGGVGKCGALEANLATHLHFEVQTDGRYRDPGEFIAF